MNVVEGGNFEMDLPGDNWSVTDEAAETLPLIRALKVYVAWCEQEAGA